MGLRLFFTSTHGTGGKLRKLIEDFVVEEVSIFPASDAEGGGGKYAVATVRAFNWETNRLVKIIARDLGIRKTQIQFAGTKDKRAITTQLFTIEAPVAKVEALNITDVEITNVYPTHHRLKLGRLYGNKFNILLSDPELEGSELEENINRTRTQLDELKGFPNFFGVQRFGAVRPITHVVGRLIVQRKFEEAVWTYMGNPIPEDKLGFEARTYLERTKDLESAIKEFPRELEFEKAMIRYLIENPEDYIGALRRFPRNLLSMFVHSYQSYLFNILLCDRIENGIPLNEPQLGDLVLAVDSDDLPIHNQWYPVTMENQSKLKKLVSKQRAFISGLLFGSDTQFAEGVSGEFEQKLIESEGLKPDDFVIPELLHASSKGIRRELVAPVKNFNVEFIDDRARFKFQLNKGTYATSLLREYMKTIPINY